MSDTGRVGQIVSDNGRPGQSVSDTGRPGQKLWKIDFVFLLLLFL